MNELISPKKLRKGDLISVVSPSAGLGELFPHRVKDGISSLERMGFRVRVEKNALGRKGWVSGTIEERVADLHSAFSDPEVKCVMASVGGDHGNQLLKYLDFELIRNNPKIFIGYSDISVLHYALYAKAGLRTFYGPCLISEFGEYPDVLDYTKESFFETLMNGSFGEIMASEKWTDDFLDWFNKENHTKERPLHVSNGYEWWKDGRAEGKIIGGCVPSINHVLGTEYWIDPQGALFFIDIPEGGPGEPMDMATLDSFFADLDNARVFESVCGLIIGRLYKFSSELNSELKEIILRYVGPYDYPVLFNANIGHCAPSITLPFGVSAEIDSSRNLFRTIEDWS
ncbi:MAG: S66 peptidase family protein [Candidatus Moraniibacteriota bacterium]